MRSIAFVFICLIVGCTPALKFAVDPSFPKDDVSQIQQAADKWNTITRTNKKISIDGNGRWLIDRVEHTKLGFNGETFMHERTISIDSAPVNATIYAVALHEFGHALGLKHVSNGVMNPDRVTIEFSVEDLRECRQVGAC